MKNFNNLLLNSDALIHTAKYDGLSNVICETLALGKPVLASDVCDNKYLIGFNERGILFNPENSNDIAEKINVFYSLDNAKITEMQKNARAYAKENLSITKLIKSYQNTFIDLLK